MMSAGSILLLAIWIGVGFIFQGVAESGLAISCRQLPDRGWHIFLGVVSIIAGMVVIAWPFDSIVVLAIVAGVWLVLIGIAQIVWALRARKGINAVERGFERLTDSASSQPTANRPGGPASWADIPDAGPPGLKSASGSTASRRRSRGR